MKDESLHPIVIIKTLLTKYGPDILEWEPAVVQKTMNEDLQAAKINVYKALACISLLENDAFWTDWQSFHFLAQALNNLHPSASTVQELSIGQLMVAVDIANTLRKEAHNLSYVPPFSEEVSKFIASQALNLGVWFLPRPLHFASPYASKTMLICKDCKNEEYFADENEEICPVCTAKYDTTSLATFSPNKDRLNAGFGKNVTVSTKHATIGVQKTLQSLLNTAGNIKLDPDNQDHICAAKIYTGIKYMMKRQKENKYE